MAPILRDDRLNLKKQALLTMMGSTVWSSKSHLVATLRSAKALNDELSERQEDQIFRIDHYLQGNDPNIEALRFGNTIIESSLNNRYIDNIQVTCPKSFRG